MSVYGKLCTIIYDLDKPPANEEEISLYVDCIKSREEKILEPMCGSGRFYVPLLERGYHISGFDISKEMLDACRTKCIKRNLVPNVFEADILSFKSKEKYKYAFIPLGSICLLIDDNDLPLGFSNIYKCLARDGCFIFSFLNPISDQENIPEWKETMRYPFGGGEIVCKQKLDYKRDPDIMDMRLLYELVEKGEVKESEYQDFPIRLYDKTGLMETLRETGFIHIEEIRGNDRRFSTLMCRR